MIEPQPIGVVDPFAIPPCFGVEEMEVVSIFDLPVDTGDFLAPLSPAVGAGPAVPQPTISSQFEDVQN